MSDARLRETGRWQARRGSTSTPSRGPFTDISFSVSAVTDAGSTVSLTDIIDGMAGAKGFAFIAGPGESLVSITVDALVGGDYAIGEFGIAFPDTCGSKSSIADLNQDGAVDGFDLAVLLAAWG